MSKPCKVLMIVENDVVPPDTRVWREALALRDHGMQVSIISPKGAQGRAVYEDCRAPYEKIEGIHIYRYNLPDGGSWATYVREHGVALLQTFRLSIRVLIRHGFDVLHVANPPDIFFPMGWFYHLLGKKFVFDQHDLAPEVFQEVLAGRMRASAAKVLYRLLLACERYSYLTADLVLAANESFRRIAITRGGCPPDNVAVVRNACVLPQVEAAGPDQALKYQALRMGRRFLLAYVGVMGIQDGVAYALHALHELVHERGRRDVSLMLMGDGSDAAALRALSRELRLDDFTTFTGWISPQEVAQNLAVADIGLSPEPHNALNDCSTMIKTLEYMAMGLPVVAFDLLETRNSVQGAGLYAVPNSITDFANKIELLLNDDELRSRMGSVGRSRAHGSLSWECSQERLLEAYDKLFHQHAVTPAVGTALSPSEISAHTHL